MRKLKRTLESALRQERKQMFLGADYHVRLSVLFVSENKTVELFMNCFCNDAAHIYNRNRVMLKAVSPILIQSATADGLKVM
jgi:hypothetical protein